MRVEGGDEHERFVEQFADAIAIRLDADHAVLGERAGTVRQQADRAQDVGNDQRLEDVQLKVAVAAADANCHVIAHDLRCYHCYSFALGRIHFAWNEIPSCLMMYQLARIGQCAYQA